MPVDWLTPGENTLRVALYDNRHFGWTVDGAAVAAEVTLTGADAFAGEEIEATLSVDEVTTIGVAKGAEVRLVLRAEQPLDLHLHGYDLSASAAPGAPAVFTFHAHSTGRFPIEAHGVESVLGQVDKALAFVEVRDE